MKTTRNGKQQYIATDLIIYFDRRGNLKQFNPGDQVKGRTKAWIKRNLELNRIEAQDDNN